MPDHLVFFLAELVDPPFAYRRMGSVSGDIFRELGKVGQPVGLHSWAVDIESLTVFPFCRPGGLPECACLFRRVLPEPFFHFRKKREHEPFPHGIEREEGDVMKLSVLCRIAFGDKHMKMGMPLQIPSERMEKRYEPQLAVLPLLRKGRACEDSFVERGCDGIEKDVQHSSVLPEPAP